MKSLISLQPPLPESMAATTIPTSTRPAWHYTPASLPIHFLPTTTVRPSRPPEPSRPSRALPTSSPLTSCPPFSPYSPPIWRSRIDALLDDTNVDRIIDCVVGVMSTQEAVTEPTADEQEIQEADLSESLQLVEELENTGQMADHPDHQENNIIRWGV